MEEVEKRHRTQIKRNEKLEHLLNINILYLYVNFTDKAKVIYAPTEIYLPYGRPATLDCHFRSNPPLTNLRWEKDGFLFDPYNVQVSAFKL